GRPGVSRRVWLLGTLAGGLSAALGDEFPKPESPKSDRDEEAALRAQFERAGLKGVQSGRTAHYLGIGDAPDAHRKDALNICEELATVYRKHFEEKGLPAELPDKQRLTVVVLAGPQSYAAFTGQEADSSVGGHFDVETNRLVVFDFRAGAAE